MWFVGQYKVDMRNFLTERFPTDPSMSSFGKIREKLWYLVPHSFMYNPRVTGFFTTMTMFELEIRYADIIRVF